MNKDIYKNISEELGISEEVVEYAYKSFWDFIKSTITSLPLSEDLTDEQFDSLRTNFNIPSLGKLACTKDKYLKIRRLKEYKNGRFEN